MPLDQLTTEHTCHAPDCSKECPPAHLMCSTCWGKVSLPVQNQVYQHHTKGQHTNPNLIKKAWLSAVRVACKEVRVANEAANKG